MATQAYKDKRLAAAMKRRTALEKAIEGWQTSIDTAHEELVTLKRHVEWLNDMPVDDEAPPPAPPEEG